LAISCTFFVRRVVLRSGAVYPVRAASLRSAYYRTSLTAGLVSDMYSTFS